MVEVGRPFQSKRKMARKTRSRKPTQSIPRATFDRLIKEITQDIKADALWSAEAVDALHEECETFLAERFQGARYLCDAFKERTLTMKHFSTAQTLSSVSA